MQPGGNGPHQELLSGSEKPHFSKYGKLSRGGLLGQKSKERTYFDSGDYALSAADRVTDNGTIQTGKAHPHRDSISHPYAPIPAGSNVDKDAIEDLHRKSASPEESPLLQRTNIEHTEPSIKKRQDDRAPREG
ncbi:uncharacterized protein N7473_012881 [Penicillium subrubescens]|uniref:uncharacterized protein n=1 Tax=Penicillium subrubescens TaxID=1316194 RepID=UPI0025455C58|nr:uncharacterized protein N7473_012881 [Penicillium subrubescens]KAJ5875534.1 hypothetical protein N7473_012881 [Penicillium subrubescens]